MGKNKEITIKDYFTTLRVDCESENRKKNLEVSKLGGWEDSFVIILVKMMGVFWYKEGREG